MVTAKTVAATAVVDRVMPSLQAVQRTEALAVTAATTALGQMPLVWVTPPFAPNAMRWSKPSLHCASSQRRPMAKP